MSGSRDIFLYFKGFNGTDIYHSDVKMRSCSFNFLYSLKIIFQYFQNFLRPNAFFYDLNLLKKSNSVRQYNIKKCLLRWIRNDAIWKKCLSLVAKQSSSGNFPENFGIPAKNFPFPRKLKIRETL